MGELVDKLMREHTRKKNNARANGIGQAFFGWDTLEKEAADEIARLDAENKRLREALQEIADRDEYKATIGGAEALARWALGEEAADG